MLSISLWWTKSTKHPILEYPNHVNIGLLSRLDWMRLWAIQTQALLCGVRHKTCRDSYCRSPLNSQQNHCAGVCAPAITGPRGCKRIILFILFNSPQLLFINLLSTLFMDKVKVTAKRIDVQFSTEIPILRFPKAKKCLSECCFSYFAKSGQNRFTRSYFYI